MMRGFAERKKPWSGAAVALCGFVALPLLGSCSDDEGPVAEGRSGSSGRADGGRAGAAARGGSAAGVSSAGASAEAGAPGSGTEAGASGSGAYASSGGTSPSDGQPGGEAGSADGGAAQAGQGEGGELSHPIGGGGMGGAVFNGPDAGGEGGAPLINQCGDGIRAGGEACDDGDTESDDGCSATCTIEYVLSSGHIDLFELSYDAVEGLALRVKDDTSLYDPNYAFRAPEEVVIDIDAALASFELTADLPAELGFLGEPGATLYLLDQNQQDGLPWPGWSTQRLPETLPSSVLAELGNAAPVGELAVAISGPGDVFTFVFADTVESQFIDTTNAEPDAIPFYLSTHFHTVWAFTALGDYFLTVTPRLFTSSLGTLTGRERVFRFHVGPARVPPGAAPSLSVHGGGSFPVGVPVELSALAEPAPSSVRYDWYRWKGDGSGANYVHVGRGPSLLFVGSAPVVADQYSVLLRSEATGRILARAATEVTITSP